MTDKRRIIARFQICSHLHAMSDFGFAHDNEPVLVAKDEHVISRWLVTDEGIYWLKHNEKLINSIIGKPALSTNAVEKQIAEILENKKF